MTQMDGSMAAKACGATGAFCLQCFATLDDALDPAIVAQGFYITRTIEEIQKIYFCLNLHMVVMKRKVVDVK